MKPRNHNTDGAVGSTGDDTTTRKLNA